jgi:deoxyribonuclease-4
MEKMAWTAASLGCEAVQVFSRSPRGGKAKPLDPADVAAAKRVLEEKDIWPLVVHVPYFLNLASKDPNKQGYSVETLVEDLRRTEMLGGKYLVTHIGHKEKDEPKESPDALARVLVSLEQALSQYDGPVRLLLENTAGMGQEIGSTFEALAVLLGNLPGDRVGACLDTAHAFGAGYDVRGEAGIREVLTAFDRSVGLKNLYAMHLNDSKGELGGRLDRHAHLGKGNIGIEAFRELVNSPLLPDDLPGLLETPVDQPGDDLENIKRLKDLRGSHAGV